MSEKGFVKVRIKDSAGIIRTIRVKGRARALNHPLRVDRSGHYIDRRAAGNYLLSRQERQRKALSEPQPAAPATPAPDVAAAAVEDASEDAAAVGPGPSDDAEAGPLLVTQREPTQRKGAVYSTWFRAMGSSGTLKGMQGAKSPDLIREDLEDDAAPSAFYSNQSGILGRVKWDGIIPLESLIDNLNFKLQFAGEESKSFDFRKAYRSWSYRYQVIERLGQLDRIILEYRDSSGRHR